MRWKHRSRSVHLCEFLKLLVDKNVAVAAAVFYDQDLFLLHLSILLPTVYALQLRL